GLSSSGNLLPLQRSRHCGRGQMHRRKGLHRVCRCVPDGLAGDQPGHAKGLHGVRRMLVLHAVREGLPDRGRQGRHPLPPAL
ncbi:Adenylylsulfate reductase beta-subunit (EC 1.8.99.2), partial [Pseudomonas fluorescens]